MDKVLALRPDMAGSDEKEKATISSLVSEASKLSSDIKVGLSLEGLLYRQDIWRIESDGCRLCRRWTASSLPSPTCILCNRH